MATTAQDVRTIALSLPDGSEKLAWGRPTFRVGGKIFAALGDDDTTIGVKCPKEDRAELIAAEPESSSCGRARRQLRLDQGPPGGRGGRGELRSILTDSWLQAAPKRLAAAHPELVAGD